MKTIQLCAVSLAILSSAGRSAAAPLPALPLAAAAPAKRPIEPPIGVFLSFSVKRLDAARDSAQTATQSGAKPAEQSSQLGQEAFESSIAAMSDFGAAASALRGVPQAPRSEGAGLVRVDYDVSNGPSRFHCWNVYETVCTPKEKKICQKVEVSGGGLKWECSVEVVEECHQVLTGHDCAQTN